MSRHHVHLTEQKETALATGRRHGVPVLLVVLADRMAQDGHIFHVTDNHVWLTPFVPPHSLLVYGDEG